MCIRDFDRKIFVWKLLTRELCLVKRKYPINMVCTLALNSSYTLPQLPSKILYIRKLLTPPQNFEQYLSLTLYMRAWAKLIMRDRTIVDERIRSKEWFEVYTKSFSFINSTILLLANNVLGRCAVGWKSVWYCSSKLFVFEWWEILEIRLQVEGFLII